MFESIKKLFSNKDNSNAAPHSKQVDMATTAPLSDSQLESIISNQNAKYEIKQLVASVGQSVGKQREHNEDSVLSMTTTISGGGAESIQTGGADRSQASGDVGADGSQLSAFLSPSDSPWLAGEKGSMAVARALAIAAIVAAALLIATAVTYLLGPGGGETL